MQKKDDRQMYTTCFSRGFWASAARDFTDLRKLVLAGILLALSVALQLFTIPLAPGLKIQITFLASAVSGVVLGPWLAFLRGAASDIIGFFVANTGGAFYFGYTLSAALGAMVYSLMFYRQRMSYSRVFGAKLIINLFVNAMLGSVWSMQLYGSKTYGGYFAISLAKNLVLLPFEIVVLCLLMNVLMPSLAKLRLIDREQCGRIRVSYVRLGVEVALVVVSVLVLWRFYPDIYAFAKSVLQPIFS